MVKNLEKMFEELEGNYVTVSFIGNIEDEVCITEFHAEIITYSNGSNYIVIEDRIDDEQHIPRIAVDTVTDVKEDYGEWLVKTIMETDIIFSMS